MRADIITSTIAAALLLWGCGGTEPGPAFEASPGPIIVPGAAMQQVPSLTDLEVSALGGPELVRVGAFEWTVPEPADLNAYRPSRWHSTAGGDDGAIFCSGWCLGDRCAMDCLDLTDHAEMVGFEDPYALTLPGPLPPDERGLGL